MNAPRIWSNTRVRSTPFTSRIESGDVRVQAYTVYNHMLLPLEFVSVVDDYWHLKEHVQLWDVAVQRQVEIVGPDAARLVQMMTPRNLSASKVGRCYYAPLVDHRGGLLNDPVITKLADDRFWLSIADSDVALWAKGLAFGLGLTVDVFEPGVDPLAVQGPKADELMSRVFGDAVAGISFFGFAHLEFAGHPMVVARTGWSKQGGFEIYVDRADLAGPLWDALAEAGRDLDVRPGCPNLIERIEGGLISYGGDATVDDSPLQCRLEQYCHLDAEIDVIGLDALRAERDSGVTRAITGLFLDTDTLPPVRTRWEVTAGGRRVGDLTSAAVSPRFGRGIALAMLDREVWEPGTEVVVTSPDGPIAAEVTAVPFVETGS
ncbi:MAG: dimethylsulfoniopropionate demethylase [Ilumatobacteraceae bacterium]